MITIKNTQKSIPIDCAQLKKTVEKILSALRYDDFDIFIWLTTNKTIRFYNDRYRHSDKPTDIISFPFHTDLQAGKRIKIITPEDKNLGDILISVEYVKKKAAELSLPFDEHLDSLLIHGMCHLLGYDHITDTDYKKMSAQERFLQKVIRS